MLTEKKRFSEMCWANELVEVGAPTDRQNSCMLEFAFDLDSHR